MVTFVASGFGDRRKGRRMALDRAALAAIRNEPGGGAPPVRRRWRRGLWYGIAAGLLALSVLLIALRPRAVAVDTAIASAPAASGRVTVLNASGYVVARRIATVASKVTGRLTENNVQEGAIVHAGDVLARLDPSTARAAWEVAVRSREAAARALAEIEVRRADAGRMLERNRGLAASHLVAQSVLDTSEADFNALAARLEQSRAELGVAEAGVRQRQQDLDDLVIRAPFTGVAISKDAQPGEMVSPISAGGGFTRTGIATLVDMDSRELEVDVNEAFIQRVHDGQAVEATLDAYPDAPLPAHVINVVPTADRQKATIKVRIALDRLEPRILPDMGVKVGFLEDAGGGARPVALVPADAVTGEGEQRAVWVVADGRLQRRAVRVGATPGDELPILEGLKPGEVVVLKPDASLRDGARVAPKAP
jgi:HlyD family secretion protein